MITALMPFIIAALIVIVIVWLKVAERRINTQRKREGREPLTEEQKIVNVIDWTRR